MSKASTITRTRQTKTPRQRAQEQLDVEERRVDRLTSTAKALDEQRTAVQELLDAALARRNFLRQHPDLQEGDLLPLES